MPACADVSVKRVPSEPHDWPHLVVLRKGGHRPPLLLVAGQSGYAFIYRELAAILSDDQPVIALQLPGVHPDEPVAAVTIEDMAALFLTQVLAAFPHGPVVLGGYSLGALVAFELALRLSERGREVPLLIALDAFAPCHPRLGGVGAQLRSHARAARADPGAYVRERVIQQQRRVYRLLGQEWRLGPGLLGADRQTDERTRRLAILRRQAAERYSPNQPAQLPLLLVRVPLPDARLGARLDEHYGWPGYVTGQVTVSHVSGTHRTLLDSADNRQRIAALIAEHIRACAAPRRAPVRPRSLPWPEVEACASACEQSTDGWR